MRLVIGDQFIGGQSIAEGLIYESSVCRDF